MGLINESLGRGFMECNLEVEPVTIEIDLGYKEATPKVVENGVVLRALEEPFGDE